ncbi:hypothetical protein [Streptomyces atratus]|uniref:hypothetical protein n=1 Tax=Streptomyces atratus TaxID=1893 RepID=UPI0036471BDD
MTETRKVVVMTVTATFEGDYHSASECPGMLEGWIDGGFEDRDDLRGWSVVLVSVNEFPLQDEDSGGA